MRDDETVIGLLVSQVYLLGENLHEETFSIGMLRADKYPDAGLGAGYDAGHSEGPSEWRSR
jgi:hypothetical protein